MKAPPHTKILTSPQGTATRSWLIDADGSLQAYTVTLEGDVAALEGPKGLPSRVAIAFTPVDETDPLTEPTVGEPLELNDGKLP